MNIIIKPSFKRDTGRVSHHDLLVALREKILQIEIANGAGQITGLKCSGVILSTIGFSSKPISTPTESEQSSVEKQSGLFVSSPEKRFIKSFLNIVNYVFTVYSEGKTPYSSLKTLLK